VDAEKVRLAGSFGVFFSGRLVARLYDKRGATLGTVPVIEVSPTEPVSLQGEISANPKTTRLSLHLIDLNGVDRGSLQEVPVLATESSR
jgi:hypothetical protein